MDLEEFKLAVAGMSAEELADELERDASDLAERVDARLEDRDQLLSGLVSMVTSSLGQLGLEMGFAAVMKAAGVR